MDLRLLAFVAAALLVAMANRGPGARADSPLAGNSVFQVAVEDTAGADGAGTFTVVTGPGHPAGAGHTVLFAGASGQDAGSSTVTVRSYTTGTDYVQTTTRPGSANLVASVDDAAVTEPLGSTGYKTTYALTDVPSLPDDITIVSKIEVSGSGIQGSAVELTTSLTNEGDFPLKLGVRYLLDFAPGGDDGPTIEVGNLGTAALSEASLASAPDEVTLSPNRSSAADVNTHLSRSGVPADLLEFVSWSHAFPFAFDYTPAGRDVASEGGLNDSAVLVYFGATEATALTLAPGESTDVSTRLSVSVAPSTPTPSPSPSPGSATPQPGSATVTPVPERPILPVELPRTGASLLIRN